MSYFYEFRAIDWETSFETIFVSDVKLTEKEWDDICIKSLEEGFKLHIENEMLDVYEDKKDFFEISLKFNFLTSIEDFYYYSVEWLEKQGFKQLKVDLCYSTSSRIKAIYSEYEIQDMTEEDLKIHKKLNHVFHTEKRKRKIRKLKDAIKKR